MFVILFYESQRHARPRRVSLSDSVLRVRHGASSIGVVLVAASSEPMIAV